MRTSGDRATRTDQVSDADGGVTSPIVLLGAPRSGTTLLYKTLCLHPDAAYISNWVRRFPALPSLAVFDRVARRLPRTQQRVWFTEDSNAYVYGSKRSVRERLFPMAVEGEPLFARHGLVDDVSAEPNAQALRGAVSTILRYGGGRRFITKRIAHNHRIPLLLDVFPGARFVVLGRDGRAVASSLSRVDWWENGVVWWYGGTPGQWREEGRDPWELCARTWVEEVRAIDAGLSSVPAERVLRLTYEKFIRRPQETLERTATFAGLRSDRGWSDRVGTLRFVDRSDSWRSALGPEAVRTIESVERDELLRQGYVV